MQANAILLVAVAAILLHVPMAAHARTKDEGTMVVLTNNHTNYLSIRCFSFNDDFSVIHLPAGGQYKFRVRKRLIYPSSTMFNCSTNMGTIIAYKYNYVCAKKQYKTCDWRFDEDKAYRWEPEPTPGWYAHNYSPNYESLNRGGVVQGYFAN
ncbi:hypothetical protein CASFOL_036714 [Castilleja foliolosa]|uniref:S-protein homolog n=1 Tax=Castilleja foliolosa TaxID=1961234 RepID=A0ABD3BPL9_9LAMI